VIGAAPDGILVIDHQGLISMSNACAEAMLGYRSDELNNQPLNRLIPEYLAGAPAWAPPASREATGLCKDGRQVPIEIT